MVAAATSFAELGLGCTSPTILANPRISAPTPMQAQAIPVLLQASAVVGQARTGSGKTLAFALPIVERRDGRVPEVQPLVPIAAREPARRRPRRDGRALRTRAAPNPALVRCRG